jgi:formate hydrogenlyase transcriptional activator
MKKRIETIPSDAVAAMTEYRWPGNIRELENFIERAVILSKGPELEIQLGELNTSRKLPVSARAASESGLATLEDAERDHIIKVLKQTDWVIGGQQGAAARLGMKRTTLQSRMRKLGIIRQD